MVQRREGRLPWELADGPLVGKDVPITSEPRPEVAPGVPAPPPSEANSDGSEDQVAEVREVRSEDPELSSETNRRVTEELREVIGAERVRVPADRPHASTGEARP